MTEQIASQVLSQASDNIQKLFDLSTRIDERVKIIQSTQDTVDRRVEELSNRQVEMLQKIAVLDSKTQSEVVIREKIGKCEGEIEDIEKRLMVIEGAHGRSADRWKQIGGFMLQLVWVILAAYLLTKLHLQAPAVP